MAKFTTDTVTTYSFTDEFSGRPVTQREEPNTIKIKITGDTTTYEKIMSTENETKFLEWLKSDGEPLATAAPATNGYGGGSNRIDFRLKDFLTSKEHTFTGHVRPWAMENRLEGLPVVEANAKTVKPEYFQAYAEAKSIELPDDLKPKGALPKLQKS